MEKLKREEEEEEEEEEAAAGGLCRRRRRRRSKPSYANQKPFPPWEEDGLACGKFLYISCCQWYAARDQLTRAKISGRRGRPSTETQPQRRAIAEYTEPTARCLPLSTPSLLFYVFATHHSLIRPSTHYFAYTYA